MSSYADRRDTRRIIVGSDFAIAFTLKGHGYRDGEILAWVSADPRLDWIF